MDRQKQDRAHLAHAPFCLLSTTNESSARNAKDAAFTQMPIVLRPREPNKWGVHRHWVKSSYEAPIN
jgi:hypothetical protein